MERHGLFRSRTDRVIGGVAAGIARSLNADPAIVRIIFALLIIFGGGGFLLYIILWIAIPEEPLQFFQENPKPSGPETINAEDQPVQEGMPPVYPVRKNNGALIVGLVLISIGAIFLLERVLPHINFHFHDFWPIVIVIAGIVLIYSSFTGVKKS